MTDNQYNAKTWLMRMWDHEDEIKEYRKRADDMLGAKIPAYDSEKIPGGADPNPTETKNIEYSSLMFEISKRENELYSENIRTFNVIQRLDDPKLRGILYAKYVNRKTWKQIGSDFHYGESRIKELHVIALDKISEFIPKGEIEKDL